MTIRRNDPVPAHLRPIVDLMGVDQTIRFLLEFGGGEIYWATNPKGNSQLAKSFGIDIAREMGRLAVENQWSPRVPLGKQFIAQCLLEQGKSIAEIARTLHTSDNTVRRYTKPQRDDRQMTLFGDK